MALKLNWITKVLGRDLPEVPANQKLTFEEINELVAAFDNNADEMALNTAHKTKTDNPHGVTKTQVGLGNVENTSDEDKPVSTAQGVAIGAVSTTVNNHKNDDENPHGVTKTQVGLGNVDNTSDANKPVSALQQAEFNTLTNSVATAQDTADAALQNVLGGVFDGVLNFDGNKQRFYNDYVDGSAVDFSLSAQRSVGAICRVRIKGDLIGTIPDSWNQYGDDLLKLSTKLNVISILFVNNDDITLINKVLDIPDESAPTVPDNLSSSSITNTTVNLDWDDSTDNVGVASYNVYQDDVLIESGVLVSNYAVVGLTNSTTYVFKISAVDAAGNESEKSVGLSVSTTDITQPTFTSVGFSNSGNEYEKTAGAGYNTAYAVSDAVSGEFTFIAEIDDIITQGGIIGISTSSLNVWHRDGSNPWNLVVGVNSSNGIHSYIDDVFSSSAYTTGYDSGDVIKIIRDGSNEVKAYFNDTLIATYPSSLAGDLFLHFAQNATSNKVLNPSLV